jgi:hypothetical protein
MKDINLIRKIAWSFHHSTGFDWDELFAEASWLYCKAMKTYDPKRGAVSTHVYKFISDELINFIEKEKRYEEGNLPIEFAKDPEISFNYFFEGLSKEAQEVAKVILDDPEMYDCLNPKEAKRKVAIELRQKGRSWREIWHGIYDLKVVFV